MLNRAAEHAPSIIRLFNAMYTKGEPYLRLGEELIRFREGTQQGYPASGKLLSLDIPLIDRRIERECKLVVHRWYTDDGPRR